MVTWVTPAVKPARLPTRRLEKLCIPETMELAKFAPGSSGTEIEGIPPPPGPGTEAGAE